MKKIVIISVIIVVLVLIAGVIVINVFPTMIANTFLYPRPPTLSEKPR